MRAATRKIFHYLKRGLPIPTLTLMHRAQMSIRKTKRQQWVKQVMKARTHGATSHLELSLGLNRRQRRAQLSRQRRRMK